jgi:proteasome lid subunit RPN8/RPN11
VVPFPAIERWAIPQAACEQTRTAVLPAGRRGTESGAFWLGKRGADSVVTTVAMPVGSRVVEQPSQWSVPTELHQRVTAYAKPRSLTLLAVVHTHLSSKRPRLSRTDRERGVRVPGVLAVIIPVGGSEGDPYRWGWFVFEDGDYRELTPDEYTQRVTITTEPSELVVVGAEDPL